MLPYGGGMTLKRQAAKLLYWLSGEVERIPTPQRRYAWPEGEPISRTPTWVWGPCQLSWHVEVAAHSLDRWHFDHWSLIHDNCSPQHCPVCGGEACERRDLAHGYKRRPSRNVISI